MAFSSLANSAAATSPADTGSMAPDVTTTPPVIARTSDISIAPGSAAATTGASLPVVAVGNTFSTAEKSAKSAVVSAQKSLSATVGQMASSAIGTGDSFSQEHNTSELLNNTYKMLSSVDKSQVDSIARSANASREQVLEQMISTSASLGRGAGGAGIEGSLGSSRKNSLSLQQQQQIQNALAGAIKDSDSAFTSHVLQATGKASASMLADRKTDTGLVKNFQEAATKSQQAMERYDVLHSAASNVSVNQQMDAAQIASRVDEGAGHQFYMSLTPGERQQVRNIERNLPVRENSLAAAAMIFAMSGNDSQVAEAARLMGFATGSGNAVSSGNAAASRNTGSGTVSGADQFINQTTADISSLTAGNEQLFNSRSEGANGNVGKSLETVASATEDAFKALQGTAEGNIQGMASAQSEALQQAVSAVTNNTGPGDVAKAMINLKPPGDMKTISQNYADRLNSNNVHMYGTPEQVAAKNRALQTAVEVQSALVATGQVAGNEANIAAMRSSFVNAGVGEQAANGLVNMMMNNASGRDENNMQALEAAQIMLSGANTTVAQTSRTVQTGSLLNGH